MIYHLLVQFKDSVSALRIIEYATFRAAFAAVLAFLVATIVGPGIVESLRKRKLAGFSPTGSEHVDAERKAKESVPTMGGVILLVGVALSGLLFMRLDLPQTWIVIVSFLLFGALGAMDDWKKLTHRKGEGMSERQKLVGQLLISGAAITALYAIGCAQEGRPWLRGPSWQPDPYPVARAARGDTWDTLAARWMGDAARATG